MEGLNSKSCLKHLVRKWNSRGTCTFMGLVMPELDSCLNLGQEHMV